MKNWFWHYKIKNTRSEVEFRTIVTGATKEGAQKRVEKDFPSPIYFNKYLGRTTKYLKEDCDINQLDTTYPVS